MTHRINLSLDEDSKRTLEEIRPHIEDNYGGVSGWFREMIKEYDEEEAAEAHVKAVKEKIHKKKSELEFLKKEKKTWEKQLEEERQETRKENKQEKLKRLRNEKEQLERQIKSEDKIREEVREQYESNSRRDLSDPEVKEGMERKIQRKIGKIEEKREKLQDLEKEIEEVESNMPEVEAV